MRPIMCRARWRVAVQALCDEWSAAMELLRRGAWRVGVGGKSPSRVRGIGLVVWGQHASTVMAPAECSPRACVDVRWPQASQ